MREGTNAALRRTNGQVHVDAPAMERLVGAIFEHAGCDYTSDPRVLYGKTPPGGAIDPGAGPGALTAFGLHKGFEMNFFMEM